MALTNADIEFFSGIYLTNSHIHFPKSKVTRNASLGIYNQIKDHLSIKYKNKIDRLDAYIAYLYKATKITSTLIENWQYSLADREKPNFYTTWFRIRNNSQSQNKMEIYAVQNGKQLEKICDFGSDSYKIIKNYCEVWGEANQFCEEHNIDNPCMMALPDIKEGFRTALFDKFRGIPRINRISVLSNNLDEYCLAYYDLKCGSLDAPTPAWDSFLSQMVNDSCRDVFRAWVYSVFKGDNFGRQVLWLHGIGESGKSVVANTIYDKLRSLNTTIVSTLESAYNMDKFSMSTYASKRFVLSADTTDRNIVRLNLVKNLTGNDIVSSREMGKAKQDIQVYCKVMLTSNKLPFVNLDSPEERSRMLLISLVPNLCVDAKKEWYAQDNGNWQACLADEFDDFIRQSEDAYYKMLKDDGHNFIDYDAHVDALDLTLAEIKRDLIVWCEDCLEKTDNPRDAIPTNELCEDFRRYTWGVLFITRQKMHYVKSFMVTFFRERKDNIDITKNFNVLLLRGYKYKELAKEKRATAKERIEGFKLNYE